MQKDRDPYRILQVAPHAEPEVIKVAYKRLARMYHPDANQSPDAKARMQEIIWAYGILGNATKRAEYDRVRAREKSYRRDHSPPPPPPRGTPQSEAPSSPPPPPRQSSTQAGQTPGAPASPLPTRFPWRLVGVLGGLAGMAILWALLSNGPPPSVPPTDTAHPTDTPLPTPTVERICKSEDVQAFLERSSRAMVSIDTVMDNMSNTRTGSRTDSFLGTQIAVLDIAGEQLIDAEPPICNEVTEHVASMLEFIVLFRSAIDAELEGELARSDFLLNEATGVLNEGAEAFQKVLELAAEPSSASEATITAIPLRLDLGVELSHVQEAFEDYGFKFDSRSAGEGEISVFGKANEATIIVLTGRPRNLVHASYTIYLGNIGGIDDEESTPGLGELAVVVLGQDIYDRRVSPWLKEHSGEFGNPLCFDGILVNYTSSEEVDSLSLQIMLEDEWPLTVWGCE